MPTQDDWRFINSFSGWLSAIGTLLAVIVSLYLSRQDSRIRLRVHVGIDKIEATGLKGLVAADSPDYLVITVTNVGRRPATVVSPNWKSRLVPRKALFQLPGAPQLSDRIPIELPDGGIANFVIRLDQFEANDPSELSSRFFLPPRRLTALFLVLQVRTSSYYRKLWIDDVMKKAAYPSV
jgi:hypothetical protein